MICIFKNHLNSSMMSIMNFLINSFVMIIILFCLFSKKTITQSSTKKKIIISWRTIMHDFWKISMNSSHYKTFINFRCHKKNDRFRSYNVLFNHKIFFCFSYSKGIRIKTISFKKTCTKTFTTSNYRIFKLNLAINANKIRKTVIVKIIIQIDSFNWCCWLSHITIFILHFSNSSCLFVLYLNIYWHFSIWCSLNSQRSIIVQKLKSCLCYLICCFMKFRKFFSYGWPLRSL